MRNTLALRGSDAMLAAYGVSRASIGRVVNRAAPAQDRPVDLDKVTIPTDSAQLESMLGDTKLMGALLADGRKFGEFITNYARAAHQKDLTVAAQVKEQVQAVLGDYLRENGADIQRPDMSIVMDHWRGGGQTDRAGRQYDKRNGLNSPRAMGAVLDKDFSGAHDYFATIWHNTNRTADVQAKRSKVQNAFSSTVPSEGGFLIPETLRSELLRVSLETSIVRPRARVIPMETLRVPFPAVDSSTNVGSVYGGIVGYWTEEGAALTASSASFSRIVLEAKKLTAYCEVPNELIADSGQSFEAFIDQLFPEALGYYEDVAYLTGTGVGEPLGVLNTGNTALVTVAKETGQAAGTIVWENIIKAYARMLPSSLSRAVWIVSPDTFPELATMALSVGTGGSAVWLPDGTGAPTLTLLGRPVIISEKASALGTAGDITFVDFGMYLIGDRQVMSAQSSPHYKFQNDMTAYRIIQRVDGRPWLQSAITPRNAGNALSPFVQIASRA